MTPRRVKRRSVMTRGTNNRLSTNSRRSHGSSNRNSMRSSRRKFQQNPVTKLMDYQHPVHAELSTQNEGMRKYLGFFHAHFFINAFCLFASIEQVLIIKCIN